MFFNDKMPKNILSSKLNCVQVGYAT